jgi:hypothetical protein
MPVTKLARESHARITFSFEISRTRADLACVSSPEFWHKLTISESVPKLFGSRNYGVFLHRNMAQQTKVVTNSGHSNRGRRILYRMTRAKLNFETFRRAASILNMIANNHLRLSAQRLLTQSVQKCAKVAGRKLQKSSVFSNETQITTYRLADFWSFEPRFDIASKVAQSNLRSPHLPIALPN